MTIEFNDVARRVGLCLAVIPFTFVDAVYSATTISAKIGARVRDKVGEGIMTAIYPEFYGAREGALTWTQRSIVFFAQAVGWTACALTTLLSAVVIAACAIPNMCINFYSATVYAEISTMRARANDYCWEYGDSNALSGVYIPYADLRRDSWPLEHLIPTKADPSCTDYAVAMI